MNPCSGIRSAIASLQGQYLSLVWELYLGMQGRVSDHIKSRFILAFSLHIKDSWNGFKWRELLSIALGSSKCVPSHPFLFLRTFLLFLFWFLGHWIICWRYNVHLVPKNEILR